MPSNITKIIWFYFKIHLLIIYLLIAQCANDSVKNKKNQRWLWYAWDTINKRVVAHATGKRNVHTFSKLQRLLLKFNVKYFTTDNYVLYRSSIRNRQHVIGKKYTQGIERNNLTFRTRIKRLNRKTICFSKCNDMHDKILDIFIEREFYA